MNIEESIQLLTEDRTVDQEFFELIAGIAGKALAHFKAQTGNTPEEAPESLAADFILALAEHGTISGEIVTRGDVGREFRRWYTRKNSPQSAELWSIVSQALLSLEKDGAVCRPPNRARFNNRNDTAWYLPDQQGKRPDWSAEESVGDRMPRVGAKGGEHDKILKPGEARTAVIAVLKTLGGEVPMGTIVACIKQHLPWLCFSENSSDSPDEDKKSDCSQGRFFNDFDLIVAEEVEHVCKNIWENAGSIRRGTKTAVEGHRVLCCYLIPKEVLGAKVKLDDIGPTSTVQDVVDDLRKLLSSWLPTADSRDDLDEWLCMQAIKGVLEKIGSLCSENGHCQAFYN